MRALLNSQAWGRSRLSACPTFARAPWKCRTSKGRACSTPTFLLACSIEDALRMSAQGRLPEAESALRALAMKDPHDADLRYRLGLVLVKQKKIDEAARVLEEATRIEPAFVFAWIALGDVRLRQGNQAEAAAAQKPGLAAVQGLKVEARIAVVAIRHDRVRNRTRSTARNAIRCPSGVQQKVEIG
jgi:predicted Zn-dependent protease